MRTVLEVKEKRGDQQVQQIFEVNLPKRLFLQKLKIKFQKKLLRGIQELTVTDPRFSVKVTKNATLK